MKKKMYILLAAALLAGVAAAVHSCCARVEPDIVLSYIGENYFSSEVFYEQVHSLEDEIDDVNGDGKKRIEIVTVGFSSNLTASQEQNNLTRLTMSMGGGKSRIYLMDKKYCERYADSEILADLADLAEAESAAGDVLANAEGKIYGISVNGNPMLEKLGLDSTEGVYVALRAVTEMDRVNFKNIDAADTEARRLIRYIIKNNINNNRNEV